MRLTEHRWDELSDLTYQVYTTNFSWQEADYDYADIVVVSFQGIWEDDGTFMKAVASAAVEFWMPDGLIYDLRELQQPNGDTMAYIWDAGLHRWANGQAFPIAVVVSDLNRDMLTSLVRCVLGGDPTESLFETLEDAAAAIEAHYQNPTQSGTSHLPEFIPPLGWTFSLSQELSAPDLCRALCKTASFLQAIEPHGVTLCRYVDWWEHDGFHTKHGKMEFSDLFEVIESARALLQAIPLDDDVYLGAAPVEARWYLRFRLGWDDDGLHLLGRFDLTLPPEQAEPYREEVARPLKLPLQEQDAESYYRAIRL